MWWFIACTWAMALALNVERIADWITGTWADVRYLARRTRGNDSHLTDKD